MSRQLKLTFPTPSRLKKVSTVLSNKEKFLFYLAIFILLGALVGWSLKFYFNATEKVPVFGGEYIEGIVGAPRFINPILAEANETDLAISRLIFSSLMTYDGQGNLVNDLAEGYQVEDDGKKYRFKIKSGARWHDQSPLTAQDIAFTVQLIQQTAFTKGLAIHNDWQEIKVHTENDQTIIFELPEPSVSFLNKLTFGILPQHIFKDISAEKFLLTDFNLKPVGSGPFTFSKMEKDDQDNILSYQLLANHNYYGKKPFLEKITFNFYSPKNGNSIDSLIEAYNKKKIDGFSLLSYEKIGQFKERKDTTIYSAKTPRYFALFLNQTKSIPLAKKEIRRALSLATDRKTIIQNIFDGYADLQISPFLKDFGKFNSQLNSTDFEFNPKKAEKILDQAGWKKNQNGLREKKGEPLEISLVTTQWTYLVKTAELLKEQWKKIGVNLNINSVALDNFRTNFIQPREYQSILFGQEYTGNEPDPFLFWHSSNSKDPGKNIAVYKNDELDELLIKARQEQDIEKRKKLYAQIEKKLTNDYPAIFLYSPRYLFIANKKIKGINISSLIQPGFRFSSANQWFVNTTRKKKSH